jgi:hypothetical protein
MLVAQPPAPITAKRGILTKFSPVASSLSEAPGEVQNIGGIADREGGGRLEEWKTGRLEDVMYPAIVLVLVVVLEFPGIRISEDEDEDENRRIRLPVQPISPTFYCLRCFRGNAGCRTQIGA